MLKRVQQIIGRSGVSLQRHAPFASQEAVLRLLRPVQTEHELIRFGEARDGGYLVPDDLEGIAACFSPGVDVVATFERDMLALGMRTFQIDGSIETSPLTHERNEFERKFLGIETANDTITLEDWVEEKGVSGDLLLQMDIEGWEWPVLAQVDEATLKRFRIIVAELHALELGFLPFGDRILGPVLRKLTRHFDVVHLHANNRHPAVRSAHFEVPPLLEVTFLRKDRSKIRRPVESLPHRLDAANVPERPAVAIPQKLYAD